MRAAAVPPSVIKPPPSSSAPNAVTSKSVADPVETTLISPLFITSKCSCKSELLPVVMVPKFVREFAALPPIKSRLTLGLKFRTPSASTVKEFKLALTFKTAGAGAPIVTLAVELLAGTKSPSQLRPIDQLFDEEPPSQTCAFIWPETLVIKTTITAIARFPNLHLYVLIAFSQKSKSEKSRSQQLGAANCVSRRPFLESSLFGTHPSKRLSLFGLPIGGLMLSRFLRGIRINFVSSV